ncbi:hypothetical protein GCM10010106_20600 [Thermopolyspora flexuosa]|uniref:Uncharacterized protein DUF4229 n=1 Tax=Thermopolyspora flexuosa TaxID=103836 RepID=A0A543J3I2_9ACTN|nr:DUF4229 domain-containing protein [Thermopolyspora flexuosa]TQM77358.1 uncharacterized protein DUF4229 [Thermopolyspora flexuosa]GGM73999.1 hypothetical protein GCM10010106_20600 [Thermopolyspora flexuosa]
MRPLVVYTLSRVGLFAVALAVLYLTGLRDLFWLLVAAFLISGLASYVLLSGQRDEVSKAIARRRESRGDR